MRRDRGIADAEERIEHRLHTLNSVQLDAIHRQLHWERRRMRSISIAALDRLIRHKPGVAAAAFISAAGVTPTRDIALILIGHAEREPVDRRPSLSGEMENEFVSIVQVTGRVDRLEMPARNRGATLVLEGDRLYPVDGIL